MNIKDKNKEAIYNTLRWIGLLPSIPIVYITLYWILKIVGRYSFGFVASSPIEEGHFYYYWIELMASGGSLYGTWYVGRIISPRFKEIVGIGISIIFIAFMLYMLYVSISNWSVTFIFAIITQLASIAIAVYLIINNELNKKGGNNDK